MVYMVMLCGVCGGVCVGWWWCCGGAIGWCDMVYSVWNKNYEFCVFSLDKACLYGILYKVV